MSTMPNDPDKAGDEMRTQPFSLVWVTLGFVALAIGAVGAALPVLPTTPFAILAAFAFGKGSPRLRRWLVNHRLFGPAIRDWEIHGAIARPYKYLACAAMALTFVGSVFAGLAPFILAVQALCIVPAAIYVLTRPDGPGVGRAAASDRTTGPGRVAQQRRPDDERIRSRGDWRCDADVCCSGDHSAQHR